LLLCCYYYIAIASSPYSGDSVPFSGGTYYGPYAIYEYRDLPAGSISAGDSLCFDLASVLPMSPAFASISVSTPSTEESLGYTTIVGDSAGTGVGDTEMGNFDLCFRVTSGYVFEGGSLLLRFEYGGATASSNGFSSGGYGGPGVIASGSDSSG
jgi:hypothetical protein